MFEQYKCEQFDILTSKYYFILIAGSITPDYFNLIYFRKLWKKYWNSPLETVISFKFWNNCFRMAGQIYINILYACIDFIVYDGWRKKEFHYCIVFLKNSSNYIWNSIYLCVYIYYIYINTTIYVSVRINSQCLYKIIWNLMIHWTKFSHGFEVCFRITRKLAWHVFATVIF